MLEFLVNNLATIVISLILLAIVVAIVRKLVRDKKSGKGTCNCGCSGCANSSACHGHKG